MKSSIRTVLLAALMTLTLSGIGAASASAAQCTKKAGSKKYTLCVAGERVGSSTEEKTELFSSHLSSGTTARIHPELFDGGPEPTIECATVTTSGTIASGTNAVHLSKLGKAFSNCKLHSGEETCSVREPARWGEETGTFGAKPENVTFAPTTGYVLGHWEIEGASCSGEWTGDWEFRGSPECTITEVEVESTSKKLVCKGEKSHLQVTRFGAAKVAFTIEETLELAGPNKGKKFSIIETA
jgi:hypothetical protein